MKKTLITMVLLMIFWLLPRVGGAFDHAVDCINNVTVSNSAEIITQISDAISNGKSHVCFTNTVDAMPLEISSEVILSANYGGLVVSGLYFKASLGSEDPFDPIPAYEGNIIKITGQGLVLDNLKIDSSVSAVNITGSNVDIIDSNITATGTAITVEDTASEIKVQDTTITGAAVGISYAGNRKVTASDLTLNNVAMPISKTEGKDVVILQDVVGKKFNTDGTQVARVAGLLEDIKTCEGSVALNIRALVDNVPQITYHGDCTVEQITKDSPLCVYHGVGTVPTTESDIAACVTSGSCECFSEGLCKFECTDLNLSGNQTVKVAYTGISDPTNEIDLNTYSYSANMTLSELGSIIATQAPTAASEFGGQEQPEAPAGPGAGEASGRYGEGEITDSGGMGMAKMGCSMVSTSATLDLGMLLIFIALTAIPVAVFLPIRNRRK